VFGWILHCTAEYSALDAVAAQGIELRLVKPQQFDLIITRDDRQSGILDDEMTPLPVLETI
jgi:hypothetical protein